MTRPKPLTPSDSDLSDFGFMPLDVGRFRRSDLVTQEEPEAIVAAILLWGAAWHSRPSASLSNDDRSLAQAAGFGRAVAAFQAIKEGALRGFVECSDGRLYHPVVAEKAIEAWDAKLKRLWRTECNRIRKHNERNPEEKEDCPTFETWAASRATASPVARDNGAASQVTKPNGHAGHVEDAKSVTRDKTAEKTDPAPKILEPFTQTASEPEQTAASQATGSIVARDNGLNSCARVTRDRDRDRDRETLEDYANASSSTAEAEIEKGGEEDLDKAPRDRIARIDLLARLAGLNVTVPAKLSAAIDALKAWEEDGIDFAATIVPTIKARTLESPSEPIYSLRYFDASVRKAHAVTSAGGKLKAPVVPRDPPKPITMTDEADERIATFRRRLAYEVGETRYSTRFAPEHCALKIADGRLLEVYFRNSFEERLVTSGGDEQTLSIIAARLGLALRTKAIA